MEFSETKIPGVWLVESVPQTDDRGWFARAWCHLEFAEHGLDSGLAQCSVSFNARKGTLRGMHFQAAPHAECKLVRCLAGAVHDVVVDLRPDSPAFKQWWAVELSAKNHRAVYIPEGVAHGFQALEGEALVHYQISEYYEPSAARGIRWDDPAFGIDWPLADPVLSDKDRTWPDFTG